MCIDILSCHYILYIFNRNVPLFKGVYTSIHVLKYSLVNIIEFYTVIFIDNLRKLG